MSLVVLEKKKWGKIGKIEIKWIEKSERKESLQPAFSALHRSYHNCYSFKFILNKAIALMRLRYVQI